MRFPARAADHYHPVIKAVPHGQQEEHIRSSGGKAHVETPTAFLQDHRRHRAAVRDHRPAAGRGGVPLRHGHDQAGVQHLCHGRAGPGPPGHGEAAPRGADGQRRNPVRPLLRQQFQDARSADHASVQARRRRTVQEGYAELPRRDQAGGAPAFRERGVHQPQERDRRGPRKEDHEFLQGHRGPGEGYRPGRGPHADGTDPAAGRGPAGGWRAQAHDRAGGAGRPWPLSPGRV